MIHTNCDSNNVKLNSIKYILGMITKDLKILKHRKLAAVLL